MFKPYLTDLYKDLLMRSNQSENVDKVSFIEYTKLPGIINDRLHIMFSQAYQRSLVPAADGSHSPMRKAETTPKKDLEEKKKGDYVTEKSFVDTFSTIFMGDLEGKMRFTFRMYDFDDDGYVTPEDIRIMMSYMTFNRNVKIQHVQSMIESRANDNINNTPRGMTSPSSRALSRVQQRAKKLEGLYQDEEGKNVDYRDRMND